MTAVISKMKRPQVKEVGNAAAKTVVVVKPQDAKSLEQVQTRADAFSARLRSLPPFRGAEVIGG